MWRMKWWARISPGFEGNYLRSLSDTKISISINSRLSFDLNFFKRFFFCCSITYSLWLIFGHKKKPDGRRIKHEIDNFYEFLMKLELSYLSSWIFEPVGSSVIESIYCNKYPKSVQWSRIMNSLYSANREINNR